MAIHLKLGNNGRPWKWNLKPLYFKFITTTIETLTGVYDAVATPAGITLHVLNAVICVTFLFISEESDVTDGVLFLLSDNAKMVTGTCFHIDGGLTAS